MLARRRNQPPLLTRTEWLAKGSALFGEGKQHWMEWRFQCPACGHIQTPADFQALGKDPQSAYSECIGRHLPDRARNLGGTPAKDGSKSPCDFAAYGLFSSGYQVESEGGRKTNVFPFAPTAEHAEGGG